MQPLPVLRIKRIYHKMHCQLRMSEVLAISTRTDYQIQKDPIGHGVDHYERISIFFYDPWAAAIVCSFVPWGPAPALLFRRIVQIQMYKVYQFLLCFQSSAEKKGRCILKKKSCHGRCMGKSWMANRERQNFMTGTSEPDGHAARNCVVPGEYRDHGERAISSNGLF